MTTKAKHPVEGTKKAAAAKKPAARKPSTRKEPIVSAQELLDGTSRRGYDPKLTPQPLPEGWERASATIRKDAPWKGEPYGKHLPPPDTAVVLPEYDPKAWQRGDMVAVLFPLNDKGGTYEQLLVAADHPDVNEDECWLVVADQNDWNAVGTFKHRDYLVEKNARRIFRQADRVEQAQPTEEVRPEPPKPARSNLLFEAEGLITGDRNASYGSPTENFQNTADLWSIQFKHLLKEGARFTAAHVAQAMMHLKLARMVAQPKRDNYLDLAGYAACGWECEEDSLPAAKSARRAVLGLDPL